MKVSNFIVYGYTLLKTPFLQVFLGSKVALGQLRVIRKYTNIVAVGWGNKPSTYRARLSAIKNHWPFVAIEDGFLRSFSPGQQAPALSLVIDHEGIYYDCYRPSELERLLNSSAELSGDAIAASGAHIKLESLIQMIVEGGLSKYNHAPNFNHQIFDRADWHHKRKILVVDQTMGDLSIIYGGANAGTFKRMIEEVQRDFPNDLVVVKTHPEVSGGKKRGYLSHIQNDSHTCVLRDLVNPIQLLQAVDAVCVVTSTMGFEALLVGKPVITFGMPWYAGWGATEDRSELFETLVQKRDENRSSAQDRIDRFLIAPTDWRDRRRQTRNVQQLFAAAYLAYARYLDPVTHELGSILDVMDWLTLQKKMMLRYSGRMIAVGMPFWRKTFFPSILSLDRRNVFFVKTIRSARLLSLTSQDCLIHWGKKIPAGLAELAQSTGARLLCMEDGFIRSVGLGSDLIRPHSLVLDESGIYFDPTKPSDLEHLLNDRVFTDDDLQRAQKVRDFIVEHNITKYNIDVCQPPKWLAQAQGKQVILVPGQVEDDASIVYGCTDVKTNLALLKAARTAHPDGFVVYKVHPDVLAKNRKGKVNWAELKQYADVIETETSVVSCINACDVIHTMTSLTGFDALLRGKQVAVYGRPFYAGWGLTQDCGAAFEVDRRKRILSLDELVAGALLHYPIYYDWSLKGYTTCEATLHTLLKERERLSESGGLGRLRVGFMRRQWRKAMILAKAFWS